LYFVGIVSTDDEVELRRLWDGGDFKAVTTLALERYGPGILGAQIAQLQSPSDASEAFSLFAEDLWKGMAGFRWRCTLRAWAYRIAHNAAVRWVTDHERSPDRNVPMDQGGVFELAERIRSSTEVHLRTEVKSEIRRLREALSPEDQRILILRIDRGLKWSEIAAVLADADLTDDGLDRETARLRQRLRLATKELRRLARERGIDPDNPPDRPSPDRTDADRTDADRTDPDSPDPDHPEPDRPLKK
jgi:RNA polymerase sigma-70 factor, ECF subfamily